MRSDSFFLASSTAFAASEATFEILDCTEDREEDTVEATPLRLDLIDAIRLPTELAMDATEEDIADMVDCAVERRLEKMDVVVDLRLLNAVETFV